MRMQVDPSKIFISPTGGVVIDDSVVSMQVGESIEPLLTNSSTCNGTNFVCNNTGNCNDSSNTGQCSNVSMCAVTTTPPT